jgi:hypothetical protein
MQSFSQARQQWEDQQARLRAQRRAETRYAIAWALIGIVAIIALYLR